MNGTRRTAAVAAASPVATAGVVVRPGSTSAAMTPIATPIASAGNTGPPRKPAPSECVRETLRDDEQGQHACGPFGDDRGHLALTREEDKVGRTVRGGAEDDGEKSHTQAGGDERELRSRSGSNGDSMREVANRDDHDRDADREEEAPAQIGDADGCRRPAARAVTTTLGAPRPVADSGEDERTRPRSDKAGRTARPSACAGIAPEAAATSKTRSAAMIGPPKSAAIAQRSCEDEQLSLGLAESDEPSRDDPETEAESHERCLRAQDQPETDRRERCEQDAAEVDGLDRTQAETLERRMAAVTRQPQGQGDEHACDARNEHDVPGWRLIPVEPMRNDFPDEMDDVVKRGLEEDGRDGHRNPQEGGEDERTEEVCPRTLVHLGNLLGKRDVFVR